MSECLLWMFWTATRAPNSLGLRKTSSLAYSMHACVSLRSEALPLVVEECRGALEGLGAEVAAVRPLVVVAALMVGQSGRPFEALSTIQALERVFGVLGHRRDDGRRGGRHHLHAGEHHLAGRLLLRPLAVLFDIFTGSQQRGERGQRRRRLSRQQLCLDHQRGHRIGHLHEAKGARRVRVVLVNVHNQAPSFLSLGSFQVDLLQLVLRYTLHM